MGNSRRRLAWFAVAILTPACALVFLGFRLLSQERELERQRSAEALNREVESVRLRLQTALEPFRLNPRPPAGTAFHGRFAGASIVLSWEIPPPAAAELRRLEQAVDLKRTGRNAQAHSILMELAAQPASVADEFGVPIASYAIPNLGAAERPGPLARLRASALAGRDSVSAAGWKMIRSARLDAGLSTTEEERRAEADAVAAESFQQGYGRFAGLRAGVWSLWGEAPYLVGLTPEGSFRSVRLDALAAIHPRLSAARGIGLGSPFEGLRIDIAAGEAPQAGRQAPLIAGILITALAMAILGGALLYRDSRREEALARMRTQFVANVSHELRTPLTSLRMLTESLHDYPDLPEHTRNEYLQTMMRENERLSRLVENVLEFSRIERGAKRYQKRCVDLAGVVQRAIGSMELLLRERGFALHVDLVEVPPAEADPDALEQAVINLLVNAMKYSGTQKFIGVTLRQEGRSAVLRVSDKGIGIRREDQERIFESFYRVPVKQNESIQGAGLGLTLVRHVMEGHGGRVEVQSEPGVGSTFTLVLPVGEAAI